MRVEGFNFCAVPLEVLDNLDGGRFADVVNIGFVGNAEDADGRAVYGKLYDIEGVLEKFNGVAWHIVVDLACQAEKFVIESGTLGAFDEVVGVDGNTMTADTAGREVRHK